MLAAIPRPALVFLERAVGTYVDLVPRHTLAEAIGYLHQHHAVAALVAGVYFDESSMFDLLRWVKSERPALPFVCCRFVDREPPRMSLGALQYAVEALGGSFVDIPSLARQHGEARIDAELRARVLSTLRTSA